MDHRNASQRFWHSEVQDHEYFEIGQSHSSIDLLPGQDVSENTTNRQQGSAYHESPNTVTPRTGTSSSKAKSKAKRVLPPLIPKDPNDSEEMKRVRNTCAARASRRRKREEEAKLRQLVDDLQVEVDYWRDLAQEQGWTDPDGEARYLNRGLQSKRKVQDMPTGTSEMESGSYDGEDAADAGPAS